MEYQPSFGFEAAPQDAFQPSPTTAVLTCVRRKKFLVVLTTLVLTAAATIVIFEMPKSFTATGSVIIDSTGPEAVNLGRVLPEAPIEQNTLASEVEILKSRELVESVVKQFNLVSDPEFNDSLQISRLANMGREMSRLVQNWFPSTQSSDDKLSQPEKELYETIDYVRERIQTDQVGQSRVIRISFTSHDPEMAASIVNTLMRLNIEEHIRLREKANAKAHDWILQRLNDLRVGADDAASAVETYRANHGLTRGRDTTLLQEEITQVNAALSTARQQRDEAASALHDATAPQISHDWDHLSSVLGSQLIQKLREQESTATARLAELSSRYGPNSIMLDPAKAQVAGVQQTIRSEIGRIVGGLIDKLTVAKANEEALSARLSALKAKIAQMDKDVVPLQGLERQATVERDLYASFLSRSKETDPWLEYPTAKVRNLSLASIPVKASFPNKLIAVPFAFSASLVLATIMALLIDGRRPGFLSMNDVDKFLGVTPLGLIPLSRPRDLLTNGTFLEAISLLFARVTEQSDSGRPRSILITSAVPGEGKSTTALALAREGAARGLSVLLIDADLRSRSLSIREAGNARTAGLVEVLLGEVSLDKAVHFPAGMGVSFLAAGGSSTSPGHVLGLSSLRTTLQAAESRYDLVVIDSPPALVGSDSWQLARSVSTTVFLTRWRHTSIKQAALAIKLLALSRTKLAGVVLSMVNVTENAQYDHGDAILFSAAMRRYYSESAAITYQHDKPPPPSTQSVG